MAVYFLDTSALVKRYIAEVGSNWVLNLCHQEANNTLVISRITWVEVLSAFSRLRRENLLTPSNAVKATNTFRRDVDTQYFQVQLDATVTKLAGRLVQQHPLRAYDSVQLASALRFQTAAQGRTALSIIFVSADVRLVQVAEREGFAVDNPNQHP